MAEEAKNGRATRSLALVGRVWGEVRKLPAFDKKRHRVPDQANPATQAFLEKLCEQELVEEAEALFQASRRSFGYKRRDLSLEAGAGFARLETRDFVLELRYELDAEDPSNYSLETSLTSAASRDLLESEVFDAAIGSRFDRLRCGLRGKVSVEATIDALEDDESGDIEADYPSDCAYCVARIGGMDAEIFLDGTLLEIRFPRLSSAGDLLLAFEAIGDRFERNEILRELLT